MSRGPRNWALVLVTMLAACGPTVTEPPPEDWFLGEWFIWSGPCPDLCGREYLIQVEVEPNGVGIIHEEWICNADSREEIVWVEEAPDLLRFEPVDPTTNGLSNNDFDFFTLRYEDDCRAIAEEENDILQMRRGPAWLMPKNELDCSGLVEPEDGAEVACFAD